ncbi:hypothetical protein EUGRSUZ_K00653 [Eucalyptus grandis]|uniref:Uncharacterized protein n=2 Tax=Eucalyptus grandis TaxID=71139 RepID=A0ACC3IRD1_EUCGR|nr:hypothetical protein EUGRSUZ_K00653 [Eucalyptus grandis]
MNAAEIMSPPPPFPPLPPSRCVEVHGVGGIGKTMAAGVIYGRLGKDGDLLDVLKVDDKLLAKGLDPEEGPEELSKSLVHCAGKYPWVSKHSVPSTMASRQVQRSMASDIGEVGEIGSSK